MTVISRRALIAFVLLGATATLSGCGKKGSPRPPLDEPSEFPRKYPAPSKYPHPEQGSGETRQSPRPEQQQPSGDSGVVGPTESY